jgi:DNA (cytosine-5)-methyltransferase 1
MKPKVASFFSGAGGLDLGFMQAGFNVAWANENDRSITPTYTANHKKIRLVDRSIIDVTPSDIPNDVIGLIGGPPCQSWSEAGSQRGPTDKRGQLFFVYSNLIAQLEPQFFLAENVSGLLFTKHGASLEGILQPLLDLGYNISYGLLNANDYGVPQDRERVIIVGYRFGPDDLFFSPPKPDPEDHRTCLRDAIFDIQGKAIRARDGIHAVPEHRFINADGIDVGNNEYFDRGGFSPIFMSRNRVRSWDSPSFTIQAGARHAPLHPQAPVMRKVGKDAFEFDPKVKSDKYRRLSVREVARIQTFPDSFDFKYEKVSDGYKMIGNAVPVEFAHRLARQIRKDITKFSSMQALRKRQTNSRGRLVKFDT